MTTRVLTPRELSTISLDDLDAYTRRDWPEGAAECLTCEGSGETTRYFANDMPVTERCGHCFGRGYVTCGKCMDSGYTEEYDYATGEWEGLYPCDCNAGKRMAELDRIDEAKWRHIDNTAATRF